MKRWGPVAFYVALCVILLPWYRDILNPDTLAYFAVAHHYLRGEWAEAINTGWSPMASWLMLPLLALNVSDVTSMRIVVLASGGFTIYAAQALAKEFELRPGWKEAGLYTTAAMVSGFALLRSGPDLLEAGLLLMYTRSVIRREYIRQENGATAGMWGALAFLTKGYALFFFVAHFTLVHVLHAWGGSIRRSGRQWVRGVAVFVLMTAPWFAAMAHKTGHLTTGTTGAWNYRLVGPYSPGYPQYFGLIPPVREHGSSMWEEPSPELLPPWSALSSLSEMQHQLRLLLGNAKTMGIFLLYTSLSIPLGFLGYTLLGLKGLSGSRAWWPVAVSTVLIYPAGYLLIVMVDRYLWSTVLLLLLMGAVVAQWVVAEGLRRGRWWGTAARLVAVGYFVSFLPLPVRMLMVQAQDQQQRWAAIAAGIRQGVPGIQGKLASCGGWNDGVQIAWNLGMPFYGETQPALGELGVRAQLNPSAASSPAPRILSSEEAAAQLEQYGVDYFLALPECRETPPRIGDVVWEQQGSRLFRSAKP